MNMKLSEKKHFDEKELNSICSKFLENRIYREVQTFAHDLKTPLVTIKGLNSLLSISQDKKKIMAYTKRIDGSVEKMTEIITSFLFEDSRTDLTVKELLTYTFKQIPMENEDLSLTIDVADDLPKVYVNTIRVSRALINIIENAMAVATHHQIKKITLLAYEKDSNIIFEIKDNGLGIQPEEMDAIWKINFSGSCISGLGLSFARHIIEDNGGHIHIESIVDVGTTVKLSLPIMVK